MRPQTAPLEDEHPLAAEAADWFLRVERDDADLEALRSWQQWLERSPAHRDAYEEIRRTWHSLDGIGQLPWPTDAEVSADAYLGEKPVHPRPERVAPSVSKRITEDARRLRPGSMLGRRLTQAAILLASAFGLVWLFGAFPGDARLDNVTTGIAEHRQIRLADGSSVVVGGHSKIEVRYSSRSRDIRLLSGEAFFTVSKDPRRPFVVEAGPGRITALGTAFNVRRSDDMLAVEVAEGRVRLEPVATRRPAGDASAASLRPVTALGTGEEAVMDRAGSLQMVRPIPAEQIATWRSGRHSYIDEPLAVVVADLNRYSTQQIVIDDDSVSSLRITATFLSDDWRGWLATLEAAAAEQGITVRTGKDAIHITQSSTMRL